MISNVITEGGVGGGSNWGRAKIALGPTLCGTIAKKHFPLQTVNPKQWLNKLIKVKQASRQSITEITTPKENNVGR